ncbi:NAD-dependent epimerase/dehydratase family protein [Streptomyces dangxiongensis]|uniref:NAD-dependent epimerase/dehydratase family protein n=1 Tax=Streptomyces dangxiongensis TaxID=1442032 RepID=A0A3G2JDY9_9ACTN|nr:NAD(P)H-binding protein [Streptomyces dangxiongensis]AYN38969.1 NAD-dependent epimerase/dehydratase family protein [Streptomyces dangxiongensis]
MILVTGATGKVGREAIRQLLGLGHGVRALSRRPEDAELPGGVDMVGGSPADPASLDEAFTGVSVALVVLAGDVAREAANIAEAARRAGTDRIVLLSSASVLHPLPHGIADEHRAAEEAVRRSGASWTFLRPGPFHANTSWWTRTVRERGAVRCWIGNNPGAPVDEYDIASAAVAALTRDGHEGRSYLLTGPETLTSREQARILGDVLGRELDFSVAPAEEVVEVFAGITGDRAAAVTNVAALHSPGVPWSRPTTAVRDLTGREPRPYRRWAVENAVLFAPDRPEGRAV